MKSEQYQKNRLEIRHKLANAAKTCNWPQMLELLYEHPDLINATRPGGKSLYTPLHQAAYGNAPPEVVQKMLAMGASLTIKNVNDEIPLDIAKKKGHHHLTQYLEALQDNLMHSSLLSFPNEVVEAQSICALRFKGYEYEKSSDSSVDSRTGEGLTNLIKPIVEDLALHQLQDDNFAAYFGLQRFLHKWGGEYLTKDAKEHTAYDFLFLHLYAHKPSKPFQNIEYCLQWEKRFIPRIESIAAFVRNSFKQRKVSKDNKP